MARSAVLIHGKKQSAGRRRALGFYLLLMLVPVLHFCFFYVYVNFNSILMAFRHYAVDPDLGLYSTFAGWDNFSDAWKFLTSHSYYVKNSLYFFLMDVFVATPLALFIAYYIYKKKFLGGFFKVVFFLPQVLSAVILGVLYRYLTGNVYQYLFEKIHHFSTEALLFGDGKMWALMLFNLIMSFGVNVLLYTNAMGGVSPSLIESAELDGANAWRQFWSIIMPKVYPTWVSLMIIEISYLCANQFQVYNLYEAGGGDLGNIGYFLYLDAKDANLYEVNSATALNYPTLAALGIILTCFVLPIALGARYLLNRVGPSED